MNTHSFTYRATFSYWVLTPVLIFSGTAFYCFKYNAGMRYRTFRFLEAPNSYYVAGVLAILFLAYAIYKFLKVQRINTNKNPIKISDTTVSIPTGKSDVVHVPFSNINELWVQYDEDDGESLIVYVNQDKDRYEFFAENFESYDRYTDFKSLMEKLAVTITNR